MRPVQLLKICTPDILLNTLLDLNEQHYLVTIVTVLAHNAEGSATKLLVVATSRTIA